MSPSNIKHKISTMSFIKYLRRLEFVNYLIKKKATGNLDNFARKNGISKRAMSDFINQLRDMGADIRYDRTRKTYYYSTNGEIVCSKFMEYGEVLTRIETSEVCKVENLCFSEKAIFIPCNNIDINS